MHYKIFTQEQLEEPRRKVQNALRVLAYTDGSCSGNPGPGGWGVALGYYNSASKEVSGRLCLLGGEISTTNNRMEMMAALKVLELVSASTEVVLCTDSQYVQKGMTEWLPIWKRKNWRNSARKPVLNKDLWQQLDAITQVREVQWRWVRGHDGNAGNELADELARRGGALIVGREQT